MNYPFPLPPLAEQHRIVAEIEKQLTRLDAGVAALQRAQSRLQRYKAAVLKAACEGRLVPQDPTDEPAAMLLERILTQRREQWTGKSKYKEPQPPDTDDLPDLPEGWVWATPGQLASTEKYSLAIGPFGSNLKVSDYRDQGVPLIFVRNIRSGNFDRGDTKCVSSQKAEELHAHKVEGGDVLITKMGDPPGDACLYPENAPTAIITADCIKWRLSDLLPSRRLFVHFVNSPGIRSQIIGITKGVAQKKVSLTRFKGICIPLPPLAEQQRIVAEVERRLSVVEEVEAALNANLHRAERLRQSILKQAFEGRLVPQDPADEPASVLLERIRAAKDGGTQGRQLELL